MILNTIKNSHFESFGKVKSLNENLKPHTLCTLKDNYLLCSNYNCVTVYNKQLELVKKVSKIDNKQIMSCDIESNFNDRIYMSNAFLHELIMCDTNFNKIKSIGSFGCKSTQFNLPTGLCFDKFSKCLYICDTNNKCIKKFDENLEFIKQYQLKESPYQIKVINNVACIRTGDYKRVLFYNLEPFELKRSYNNSGTVSILDSHFYQFNINTAHLYCYNSEGMLVEHFDIEHVDKLISMNYFDGGFIKFNDEIIMSSYSNCKILKLKKLEQ